MKIIFYGTREYDHYYFDVLAADPEYGCEIRFLTANLDADTAPLAQGGDAVCAFVNADCSAPVLEKLAQVGIRCLLLRCAGYNNVDLAAAQKCGITVLRVPGYSPEAVAEHAMALAQAANRRICKAYIKVRNNNFALDGLLGYNLYGSSAGIVGTGRIGAAMARICHGFGMTVLAYDQYRNPALDGIVRYVELDELLRTADLISLHCPLTAETRHIINADTIKMMRDNAILVNTSRGGLIDTNALIDALRARKFAGPQRVDQRVGVDQPTAARVDKNRVVAHHFDGVSVDYMARLGCQRAVQTDKVCRAQQLVQLHIAHNAVQRGVPVLVIGQHRHAKTVTDARHGRADAPRAHNARRRAVQVVPQQTVQRKVVVAHLDIRLADASVCGLRQRHSVLGHGLRAVARHAQHRDAAFLRRGQVHIIVPRAPQQQAADAHLRQLFQHRSRAIRIDERAHSVPALRQRRGVRIKIRRQKPDLAAIFRVRRQHIKIVVVVFPRTIKNNFHKNAPSLLQYLLFTPLVYRIGRGISVVGTTGGYFYYFCIAYLPGLHRREGS